MCLSICLIIIPCNLLFKYLFSQNNIKLNSVQIVQLCMISAEAKNHKTAKYRMNESAR